MKFEARFYFQFKKIALTCLPLPAGQAGAKKLTGMEYRPKVQKFS
jgi:hypothetical protein